MTRDHAQTRKLHSNDALGGLQLTLKTEVRNKVIIYKRKSQNSNVNPYYLFKKMIKATFLPHLIGTG